MGFMKYFKPMENYDVKYITAENITARKLPLCVSTNSTFCKELQELLNVYRYHDQVPLIFSELREG